MKQSSRRGFTLLELIIVIAILAILSVAVILVINPAETLARARDSQRFSDLAAVKAAIGLYLSQVSTPDMDGDPAGWACGTSAAPTDVWIATALGQANITDTICLVTDVSTNQNELAPAAGGAIDGNGWVPVPLADIPASIGSPLSNYPLDPNPSTIAVAAFSETDRTYLYRCAGDTNAFEINTSLESQLYRNGGTDDKEQTDGGNNPNAYEIGTDPGLDLCGVW